MPVVEDCGFLFDTLNGGRAPWWARPYPKPASEWVSPRTPPAKRISVVLEGQLAFSGLERKTDGTWVAQRWVIELSNFQDLVREVQGRERKSNP